MHRRSAQVVDKGEQMYAVGVIVTDLEFVGRVCKRE